MNLPTGPARRMRGWQAETNLWPKIASAGPKVPPSPCPTGAAGIFTHVIGLILMPGQNICVALVDDDAVFRDTLASLLELSGMAVEQYDTGEDFLAAAAEECQASCVVLDMQLGTMTGLEVAQQLPAVGFLRPVIFITGSVEASFEKQAEELGCAAFLRKPFRRDALIEAIMAATSLQDRQGQGA
jgi:FixJ family two-component response regulator